MIWTRAGSKRLRFFFGDMIIPRRSNIRSLNEFNIPNEGQWSQTRG
jgi:hypothetical protein